MKNHKLFRTLESLAVGKGFYIVLALCLAAVGATGYYLLDAVTTPLQPAATQTPVTLPDEQPTVTPELPTLPSAPVELPQEITLPDEEPAVQPEPEPEPEPVLRPEEPVAEPEPEPAAPTVFTWPVKGEVLREFSVETLSPDPTMGDWRTHAGVDIRADLGTRVLCMTRGTVAEVWEDDRMGTCVRVDHEGGLSSIYANLSAAPTVKPGDPLEIGAILGAVGNTATSEIGMPPHLHLEVVRSGAFIDPLELLPEK